MRVRERMILLLVAAALAAAAAPACAEFPEERPAYVVADTWSYREAPADLSPPRTLIYCPITMERLEASAAEWARNGFSGVLVRGIMPQWHSDVWAADGDPATMGEADATLQTARRMNEACRRAGVDANFLNVSWSGTLPDWFDDAAWAKINSNFRQGAVFAREAGFRGLSIDTEYTGEQYKLEWPGYTYEGYTPQDLVAKIGERMQGLLGAVYDAWPEIEILHLPGGVDIITSGWVEEAARRDAPGGIHFFSEGPYDKPSPYWDFANSWRLLRGARAHLSDHAWDYFRRRCSVAPGMWPIGNSGIYPGWLPHQTDLVSYSPDDFRAQYAALCMIASRYNWIYAGGQTWWGATPEEQELYTGQRGPNRQVPPNLEAYRAVVRAKQVLDDPMMLALARQLRANGLRDYSQDLGWGIRCRMEAPKDKTGQTLWPYDLLLASPLYPIQGDLAAIEDQWRRGIVPDAHAVFGTLTHWNLIGPFENPKGHLGMDAVYPPEREIDFAAFYATPNGWLRWFEHRAPETLANVDLARVIHPSEYAVGYALGYLTVERDTPCQIRLSGNDRITAWLGGAKIFEKPYDSVSVLDEFALDVVLPKGTTPLLLKVGNAERGWDFYCRVTDRNAQPLESVRWSLRPPGQGPEK